MSFRILIVGFVFASTAMIAEKPRVFVTGGNSFQVNGTSGQEQISGTGDSTTAEGVKLFQNNCAYVSVNMRRDKADYIVSVTDDGSGAGRKGRRAVLFNPAGDLLLATSTRSLKNAVKDTCEAIQKDWAAKAAPNDAKP